MRKLFFVMLLFGSLVHAKKDTAKSPEPKTESVANVSDMAIVAPQEIKVGVKGLVCAFCAQGIEKKFKTHPEVSSIEVSLQNKYVKLKFKEGKSLPKTTISEILKDSGYEAVFGE